MSEQLEFPPLTRKVARLIKTAEEIRAFEPEEVVYQHTVFCQTGLPYKDQGTERLWEKKQGDVFLSVEAGRALDPIEEASTEIPLPFGPKPRLVLMHLNAEAVKRQSPEVEVEDSMTAFCKRVLRYEPNGRAISRMKNQLTRLATATIRLATALSKDQTLQVNAHIVSAFDLWFPKDDRQRVLWPSTVRLSDDYFRSLSKHAVPLDERAIAELSNTSAGLDAYSWLAQRLHRIDPKKPQWITWKALKDQFGDGYNRMDNFKAFFRGVLGRVHALYPQARFEEVYNKGFWFYNSPPPVPKRFHVVKSLPK